MLRLKCGKIFFHPSYFGLKVNVPPRGPKTWFPKELFRLILFHLCVVTSKDLKNLIESVQPTDSPVKVTAVFINCEIDDLQKYSDNEDTRFERQELSKHNALRNCDKKLALTIKLTSASANSADEYVPIDHVLDGHSKRRVRLLNPYVLRLRRDAPLEAYKLRFIETVSGLLATSKAQYHEHFIGKTNRIRRSAQDSNIMDYWHSGSIGTIVETSHVYPVSTNYSLRFAAAAFSAGSNPASAQASDDSEQRQFNKNVEESVSRFSAIPTLNASQRPSLVVYIRAPYANRSRKETPIPNSVAENQKLNVQPAKRAKRHEKNVIIEEEDNLDIDKGSIQIQDSSTSHLLKATGANTKMNPNEDIDVRRETESTNLNGIKTNGNSKPEPQCKYRDSDNIDASEKEFALYEIEKPTLWFFVHIHLFEKLSTLKGNTLWSDITKGVPVSLSSMSPEWSSSELSVQYKPINLASREDYLLPKSSLCLLVPVLEENMNVVSTNTKSLVDANYILVPSEDVMDVDKTDKTKSTFENVSAEEKRECRRKVIVRVARALNKDVGDKLNVVSQASDKFLTMRHRGIRQAQVDLEARADDNRLVQASASGRIAIIVADNTRGTRSTLTVQVTNTGLSVARFRTQLRECDSDLTKLSEQHEGGIISEVVLLPPRQTRRLRLRLTGELAAELQHCSVYLLNENGESVAVRDVLIKKGDHCYCVWHCDCVCYGDNPRLPCREMSAARQDAAGLPSRRGARFARACSYADVTTINVAVVAVGVIAMLLLLGVLKGLLGLVWPRAGVWGLDWILEEPRPMDQYFESHLRARRVVYDSKGWPVHPDTLKRTVRVVRLPVEFLLNVVFFVVTPGFVAVDTLKHITKGKCHASAVAGREHTNLKKTLNGPQQTQGHKLRTRLQRFPQRKWMTPEAEDLLKDVWKNNSTTIGFNSTINVKSVCPLMHDECLQPELRRSVVSESDSDSDQEDTAFVLMRMKKSSESLARNQIKPDAANSLTEMGHETPTPTQPVGKENLEQRQS